MQTALSLSSFIGMLGQDLNLEVFLQILFGLRQVSQAEVDSGTLNKNQIEQFQSCQLQF